MNTSTLVRLLPAMVLGLAIAGAAGTSASAGDLMHDWHGWYAGGHIGGTWGEFDFNPLAVSAKGRGGNVMGGGQLGYNWESGRWLLGVEADISAIDVRAKSPFARFEEDWMSTIRGRIGLKHDGFVPFISAGIGITDAGTTITGFGSRSGTRVGFAGGVGIDVPWSDRWSWRIEYLYVGVPHDAGTIGFIPVDSASDNHTFRLAVNYAFD